MKTTLLALSALPLLACGSSGPLLAVTPVGSGSVVDRIINAQESILGIVERSSTVADAARDITTYCTANSSAIEKAVQEVMALAISGQGEALEAEAKKREDSLQKRAEKVLAGKTAWFDDESLQTASKLCFPMIGEEANEGDGEEANEGDGENAEGGGGEN
jgi:hypothetical protein